MENLSDALDSKDKLKLNRLDDIIKSNDKDEQSLLILSSDTLSLNLKLEEYLSTNINHLIKIDIIEDGLFKKILSNVKEYKNKYILINLFSIKDYISIQEEFQFKRDYIPQERLKFIFLLNFTQYESFKTKAYDFFSFNNFFHHFIDNSFTFVNDIDLSELDDMIKEYGKIKDTNISKQSRMKYLYDIAFKAKAFSQYDFSLKYYENALLFANKLKDDFMIAVLKTEIAEVYLFFGKLNMALLSVKNSLKIFKKLKNKKWIGNIFQIMGIIYRDLGNLNLAENNFNSALQISIKENFLEMIGTSKSNIGLIHLDKGDFESALKWVEEGLSIFNDINHLEGTSRCMTNLGLIYQYKKDFDVSLKYQNESLLILKKINNLRGMAITLGNIGNIYKDKKDFNLALKYQKEALIIFKDIRYMQGVSETLNDISVVYNLLENKSESIRYKNEALEIAKSLEFHAIISKIEQNK